MNANRRQIEGIKGFLFHHWEKRLVWCFKYEDCLHLHSPSTLKKTMLKTEASSVAGRKMAPSSEIVFIDVLSRLLAWASRR